MAPQGFTVGLKCHSVLLQDAKSDEYPCRVGLFQKVLNMRESPSSKLGNARKLVDAYACERQCEETFVSATN